MLEEKDVFFGGKPATSKLSGRQLHPPLLYGAAFADPISDATWRAPEPHRKFLCRIYFSCHFLFLLFRQMWK